MIDGAHVCRKAQKAEGDLRRATADLRAREREREAAESRAAAAQAESEKGANSGSALAAAKRVRLEGATTSLSLCSHGFSKTCAAAFLLYSLHGHCIFALVSS